MSYRLLSDAPLELQMAVAYYENIHPDLALEFLEDFEGTIRNVVSFPEAWTKVSIALRRCLFKKFPHAILYTSQSGTVIVAAVMHLHKNTEKFFRDYS